MLKNRLIIAGLFILAAGFLSLTTAQDYTDTTRQNQNYSDTTQQNENYTDPGTQNENYSDTTGQNERGMMDQGNMQSGEDMKAMMQKMHTEMMNSELTGDPDKDFAHLMIHHHQGAINMSEKVVAEGRNEEIKRIAQDVINKNTEEIAELKRHSEGSETGNTGTEDSEMNRTETERTETTETEIDTETGRTETETQRTETQRTETSGNHADMMQQMMQEMGNMQTTGDIDRDYAQMMIRHHEESIRMTDNYLSNNQNGQLADLAKSIKEDSRQDISELERFTTR
jgi:uncharacterized protein (DUF305 family)